MVKERARYSLGTCPCSHMTVKFSRLLPMPVATRPWFGGGGREEQCWHLMNGRGVGAGSMLLPERK